MKPVAVLIAGTISLVAAIIKLVFGFTTEWVWILLPLWSPMLIAYFSFVWIVLHQLALGNVVVDTRTAEQKSDAAKQGDTPKIDLMKPIRRSSSPVEATAPESKFPGK